VESGVDIAQASADDDRVTLGARDGRRVSAQVVILADGVHSASGDGGGWTLGWPGSAMALDSRDAVGVAPYDFQRGFADRLPERGTSKAFRYAELYACAH
jgi:hypothetical protein